VVLLYDPEVQFTHPICHPAPQCTIQDDDIPGKVRFLTYEVLKAETNNPRLRWAYLPYSMHMAGPREAIQHMIIRKNYGGCACTHTGQHGWSAQAFPCGHVSINAGQMWVYVASRDERCVMGSGLCLACMITCICMISVASDCT
jgi:hypothetical protein